MVTEIKTEKAIADLIKDTEAIMRRPLEQLKDQYLLAHTAARTCDIGTLLEDLVILGGELRIVRDIAEHANKLGLLPAEKAHQFFKDLGELMEHTAIIELEDLVLDKCNCKGI